MGHDDGDEQTVPSRARPTIRPNLSFMLKVESKYLFERFAELANDDTEIS